MMRLFAALSFALVVGCGSTASSTCERLDDCNAVNGQSVPECTEALESLLEACPSAERQDVETAFQACLWLNACSNFILCTGLIRTC